MKQVKKNQNETKNPNHKHPSPDALPSKKFTFFRYVGFFFFFWELINKSCIWLQHLESTSKFHLCLVFLKHERKRTGFLKKAKNNNVL